MISTCKTVFNVAQEGFHGWPVVWVSALVALAATVIGLIRKDLRWTTRWAALVFVLLLSSIVVAILRRSQLQAIAALQNGKASLVEGVIERLVEVPSGRKGLEKLIVNGHMFAYSDFVMSPGFNVTARRRCALAVGMNVKVWYRSSDILRLDICESPAR